MAAQRPFMSRKPTLDPKDLSDDGTEVRRVAADHDAAREALSEETNRDDKVRLSKDEEETVLRAYKESKEKAEGHRVFKQFRDVKFKPGSTAFDRHNPERTGSFHGFFALFWLGLAFLAVKTVLQHWRRTGHFFRGELATMYRFNLLDLATADAVMVSSSVFVVLLQMAIFRLGLSWNKVGWLIENTWQASYLAIVVRLSYSRDWQWIQCVVIVLHCCVMLMKQHSYATYMGYLSEVHKAKGKLERKLVSLRETEGQETAAKTTRVVGPSSEEEEEANILGEIGQLSDELTHDGVTYPENLTFANYVDYLLVPSLVYDIVYPRTERIRWWFVLEKTLATLGTFALMTMIVEHYILPVIPADLATMTTNQKFEQLPWLMLDMVFPFITMYLLTFYIIFECVCQWFAEITRFADRNFYNDWWNSLTWEDFARDWNVPVHRFLLRHVYHSSMSVLNVKKSQASLITFFLSSVVHEMVMACMTKKIRLYLLCSQMLQLPLVVLMRRPIFRKSPAAANVFFWFGLFCGPSFLCLAYVLF